MFADHALCIIRVDIHGSRTSLKVALDCTLLFGAAFASVGTWHTVLSMWIVSFPIAWLCMSSGDSPYVGTDHHA